MQDIYQELEALRPKVEALLETGSTLAAKSPELAAQAIKKDMNALRTRWDSVMSRANDRKNKLDDATGRAESFHNNLTKFINWLTDMERKLKNLKPVSRLVEPVSVQIKDHMVVQDEVASHREVKSGLEKDALHLKYFSQKQDVVLIKNLVLNVQHRWDKIVSQSSERARQLDTGHKEAKQVSGF